MNYLELIETTVFSRERKLLMDDDEFQLFQTFLLENYEYGDTISHTGGCKHTGMKQQEFAEAIGSSVDLVRSWEQKRRFPSGMALKILFLIEKKTSIIDELRNIRV
ncbi:MULTISPECIES: helix-turn-helix domain-containing protein [Providencia]|uniref:helix-turn-helix domain-containing protein n=1 Tax=Providencia TaxID=586 RepID=UPI00197DB439|nr:MULTISPECIES: hypothetical protein [Providencia]MBN4865608.1 hypothetical protein [Providencia stuartii]MBN4874930.1 hypothetical protein [Providencia stuartii]MBN4879621.1 hypothetical protein [Providencia stuartii]MBN4884129.1 hypothetical protein [Providencia stuartii]